MKRIAVAAVGLAIVAAGAIGIQRAVSNSGDGAGKAPNSVSSADASREKDRALLKRQAEEQATLQQKALDELADQVKERAEQLKDATPGP